MTVGPTTRRPPPDATRTDTAHRYGRPEEYDAFQQHRPSREHRPAPERRPAQQHRPSGSADENLAGGRALGGFLHRHGLFCVLLLVATLVRVIALLGYPPALWYPDSLPYVQYAIDPHPYAIRPVGYSFLLTLLEPFHSVLVVTAVQHAMGLAMGVLVYALLRVRFRLPAWGATLAAVPALLSVTAIQIEHFVLSDTFFGLLVTLAVVVVMWRPAPRAWACGLAGLLLAWAALVRSQGLLLAIPCALYLAAQLTRRQTRRRALSGIIALGLTVALPLLGYAWWFDQANGTFQLTTSTGAFLYSRVAGFADCAVIQPPVQEQWLCPRTPVSQRQFTGYYVWASGSPLNNGPAYEFSSRVNSLATDFALRTIEAQPTAYLKAVWHSTFENFSLHRDPNPAGQSQNLYLFPSATPLSLKSLALADYEDYAYGYQYNGNADPSTSVVQPYAGWIRAYQRFGIIPGPLFGVIVLLGLLGIGVAWQRFGGAVALPWLTGVALIVTPAATADFDARYVVASIPVFCVAAVLGLKEIHDYIRSRRRQPEPDRITAGPTDLYLTD